jgi:hypothetical protein
MKLASYNVENLFMRARALNGSGFSAEGRVILKAQADINSILGKDSYTATDKKKIIELLDTLGLKKSDENKFAILRQNRGHLVKRPQSGPIQVVTIGSGGSTSRWSRSMKPQPGIPPESSRPSTRMYSGSSRRKAGPRWCDSARM